MKPPSRDQCIKNAKSHSLFGLPRAQREYILAVGAHSKRRKKALIYRTVQGNFGRLQKENRTTDTVLRNRAHEFSHNPLNGLSQSLGSDTTSTKIPARYVLPLQSAVLYWLAVGFDFAPAKHSPNDVMLRWNEFVGFALCFGDHFIWERSHQRTPQNELTVPSSSDHPCLLPKSGRCGQRKRLR